jgi:hypothetical protein
VRLSDDVVVAEFASLTEAAKAVNVTRHAISKVCLGINTTAADFGWRFKDSSHQHEDADLDDALPIDGYANYLVFPDGRVYNAERKKFLKPCPTTGGLHYVTLCSGGAKKNHYISTLVREYFPVSDEEDDTNSLGKDEEGSS